MIRPYDSRSDDDAIVQIFLDASREAHSFLGEAFITKAAQDVRTLYLPNANTHVLTQDGAIRGFIALVGKEVGGFFMDPPHRGHGHGRAMMDDALAREGQLELDVFARNAIGRRFYSRYGFVEIGARHDPHFDQQVLRLRSPG